MDLSPAYGRDYKSASAVRDAWESNADFIMEETGQYINKEDAVNHGVDFVIIWFKRNRESVLIDVTADQTKA